MDGEEERKQNTAEELEEAAFAPFGDIQKAIEEGEYEAAEKLLDEFEERGAEWYYTRAVLCKKRSWFLESSRSLNKAIELDPENEKYRKEREELDKTSSPDGGNHKKKKKRLGGKGKTDLSGCVSDFCDVCGEGCCTACCEGCFSGF